jgi:hypothetical protein
MRFQSPTPLQGFSKKIVIFAQQNLPLKNLPSEKQI